MCTRLLGKKLHISTREVEGFHLVWGILLGLTAMLKVTAMPHIQTRKSQIINLQLKETKYQSLQNTNLKYQSLTKSPFIKEIQTNHNVLSLNLHNNGAEMTHSTGSDLTNVGEKLSETHKEGPKYTSFTSSYLDSEEVRALPSKNTLNVS